MEYQRKRCFLLNTKQQILNSMFPIESQNYVFIWQTLNNMFPTEKQKIMLLSGKSKGYVSNQIAKLCFLLKNNQKNYVSNHN